MSARRSMPTAVAHLGVDETGELSPHVSDRVGEARPGDGVEGRTDPPVADEDLGGAGPGRLEHVAHPVANVGGQGVEVLGGPRRPAAGVDEVIEAAVRRSSSQARSSGYGLAAMAARTEPHREPSERPCGGRELQLQETAGPVPHRGGLLAGMGSGTQRDRLPLVDQRRVDDHLVAGRADQPSARQLATWPGGEPGGLDVEIEAAQRGPHLVGEAVSQRVEVLAGGQHPSVLVADPEGDPEVVGQCVE
jgi:hypothetical protein